MIFSLVAFGALSLLTPLLTRLLGRRVFLLIAVLPALVFCWLAAQLPAVIGGYALGGLEVLLTALPGIGDILPAGLAGSGLQSFLRQWLPSSLSGYRDAFVFVALILMLLFRPNGIVGKRARDEL